MEQFFNPKSIAVIGASDQPDSVGSALMENIFQNGFKGPVVPINPNYETVHGQRCYADILQVDPAPELAIIATPIATAPDIVRQCVWAGVKGVIIVSAGGKELGESGALIEEQIKGAFENTDMRIVGPNCMGTIHTSSHVNATFVGGMPPVGNLAVISQSGAICAAILDRAVSGVIGFSHFVSTGSMLDVDFGDLIDYLGNDGSVKAILIFMENLTNPRKFMSAARSVSRIKPIIVLKAGASETGAKAASTHIGAIAGEDAVYNAAFKRAGIVRVPSLARLFDCSNLMAKQPRPLGKRLAILTNGGGPGVMAVDALAEYDLEPAAIPEKIMEQFNELLPPYWSRGNPIDILGNASAERYTKALEICLSCREFDALLVIMVPQDITPPEDVATALAKLAKRRRIPIFTSWMGGKRMAKAIDILHAANIPTYETPERAVRAFMYLYEYTRNLELLSQVPPKLTNELYFNHDKAFRTIHEYLNQDIELLNELQSKEILAAYGVPVCHSLLATTEDEAVARAAELDGPLVMKLLSHDIPHKTDAGGIQLDLRTEADIRRAYTTIMDAAKAFKPDARIDGVSLQRFIPKAEFEVFMGSKTDDNFGQVLYFGAGGEQTKLLHDKALGLPPLNRLLARRMMEGTRIMHWLEKGNTHPKVDLERIEEMLLQLSQMVVDFPEIVEMDINPVLIKNGSPIAVDARIKLKRIYNNGKNTHLVISPYPQHLERHDFTDMQMPLFIRPIKPEDAPLFEELFSTLTPTSIYYRFFSVVKTLSPEILARFTQIDYDREISFVGLDEDQGRERMLGVANILGEPSGKRGEFSVLIGDPWHGKGIGAKLLLQCLRIAQERGMETVWGTVLAENKYMLELAKKVGFSVKAGEDHSEFKLNINLKETKL